mmetsp:Transcript_26322/g.62852  ORF Transcript_26322/g.62852 Transcript_26322/m.62852 type:complete len:323 (-) Transcript_26322:1230-2198(-)
MLLRTARVASAWDERRSYAEAGREVPVGAHRDLVAAWVDSDRGVPLRPAPRVHLLCLIRARLVARARTLDLIDGRPRPIDPRVGQRVVARTRPRLAVGIGRAENVGDRSHESVGRRPNQPRIPAVGVHVGVELVGEGRPFDADAKRCLVRRIDVHREQALGAGAVELSGALAVLGGGGAVIDVPAETRSRLRVDVIDCILVIDVVDDAFHVKLPTVAERARVRAPGTRLRHPVFAHACGGRAPLRGFVDDDPAVDRVVEVIVGKQTVRLLGGERAQEHRILHGLAHLTHRDFGVLDPSRRFALPGGEFRVEECVGVAFGGIV